MPKINDLKIGEMKKLLLILSMFLIFFSGTTETENKKRGPWIDPCLQPSVESFIADCHKYRKRRMLRNYYAIDSIYYDNLLDDPFLPNVIGGCSVEDGIVVIDQSIVTASAIKLIVYHELGHCVLLLDHDDMNRLSIMNSRLRINDTHFYFDSWETLVENMFKSKNKFEGMCCPYDEADPCRKWSR